MSRVVDLGDVEPPSTTRQVCDDERRLYRRAREAVERQPDGVRSIELSKIGTQAGISKQRTREIGRTWKNEGRFEFAVVPDRGRLTDTGLTEPLPGEQPEQQR